MIFHLIILIQIWDDLGRDIQTVFCLDPWAWASGCQPLKTRGRKAVAVMDCFGRPVPVDGRRFGVVSQELIVTCSQVGYIYIYVCMDIQYAFTIHYYSFIVFSSCSLHFFAVFRVWSDCDILFDLSILHYLLSSTFCWLNEKTLWTNQPVGIRHLCLLHCLGPKVLEDFSEILATFGEHQKIWKPSGILCQFHAVSLLVPLHPATRYLDGPCS